MVFRYEVDEAVEAGPQRCGDGSWYDVEKAERRPSDLRCGRLGDLLNAVRVAAGPRRIGVGEVMRVGELVDRPRASVGQRPLDGVVDRDQTTGRIRDQLPEAVGCAHRMIKGGNEI